MCDKEKLICNESGRSFVETPRYVDKTEAKLPWYFATGFLLFWGLLFFAVVIPFFNRLPTAKTMEDSKDNVFIAERAYKNLYTLSNIGTKMIGSTENEIETVQYLLKELNQIKTDSLKEYFDIEIDVSQVSGQFLYQNTNNMYQGVQNVAAKLTSKNSKSNSYLLINSHFDSKPETPSAGDDCFMVATMLEILRVMATTEQTFENPIVFLFNGAEESSMLASHGFVNQHKWAPNLKAVINLDAAGSGGREILFQSGPKNSWLVDYYNSHVKHPFGHTLGEEIYQTGMLPSDSDYTQFKTHMPGLDIGQCVNGFIYHTKYDKIDVIPQESVQNTGENLLGLVRGLSNATELHNSEMHNKGNAIYFDFLGIYFIHYSETTGIYLNYSVAGATIILIFLSMSRTAAVSNISTCHVMRWFILVLIIQLISFVLGLVFPALVAHVFDNLGLSLTYFSTPLLVIGLYVCPSLIGLSLPITMYYSIQCNRKIPTAYHIQLSLHAQAFILAFIAIYFTAFGLRSTYIFVIPLTFYIVSLTLNLMTTLHDRGYAWTGLHKAGQVIPFLYSCYLFYLIFVVLTPMLGRSGSSTNHDLKIAVVAAVGTILSFGFLVPLINTFRRPSFVVLSLLVITALSMYLASSTQIGFPYRPKTNGHRVSYLHVRKTFYEYDGSLSRDESGYLFNFQDRLEEKPLLDTNVDLTGLVNIKTECEKHMMCGMPLYDYRFVENRLQSKWLPRAEPIVPPGVTTLEVLRKTILNSTTVQFEFHLMGPAQMSLFIEPYEDVTIMDWSFLRSYLEKPPPYPLSYHIFFNYGIDSSPLKFFIQISKANGDFNVPLMQLGVSGHFVGDKGDEQSMKFASSYPSFSIVASWPSSYQRYIF
ncbi:endoplasmic reticulum metallopeptidase 1 [Drosophila grimshawi]|uniref:endoplasmic reticulum metallopeptidase 1 n=1 Tax=Drosophila grimshawi TaxID=7222 RepID=UPI000C870CCA|nr:endoplasmic reticulum metallopeptidase 1 [Drosophila grimshawi]